MHALVEIVASLIVALAAAAFAQFGIDLQPSDKKTEDREVRRTDQRQPAQKTDAVFIRSTTDC
jgi:hypothetical protein